MDTPPTLLPVLSIRDAAHLIGVHRTTLAGWMNRGVIPSYLILGTGKVRWLLRVPLLRFLEEGGINNGLTGNPVPPGVCGPARPMGGAS